MRAKMEIKLRKIIKYGLAFALLCLFVLPGWGQTLPLDQGVYWINQNVLSGSNRKNFHLYFKDDKFLYLDANFNERRIWYTEKQTINGVDYFRFRSLQSSWNEPSYIYLVDNTNQPMETGAIKVGRLSEANPNDFLFKLEPFNGRFAIIPYSYYVSGDQYGWYNKENTSTIGVQETSNDPDIIWKWTWSFSKFKHDYSEPVISGPTSI